MLTRQATRFAICGALATGLHFLVAVALIYFLAATSTIANGVAFLAATIFSYFVNTLWSFERPLHGRNFSRFASVSLVGLVLSVVISGVSEHWGMHYVFGIGVVTCTVPLVTFGLHRFWTFR